MNDLIDRTELLKAFGLSEKTRKYGGDGSGVYNTMMLYAIQNVIENAPTVQFEHKKGKWIDEHCSECGQYVYHGDVRNYCPNCGADMRRKNTMTNEEAIKIISNYEINGCGYCHQGGDEIEEAFEMAIKALE